MSKSPEVELSQIKTAMHYLIGLLEEGSLVEPYDDATREEIATVLKLLLDKIADLPTGIPDHLVQATAIRSIVGASERHSSALSKEKEADLARNMREAEASASIQGHILGDWERVSGSEMEYQATCQNCGGFVYVSHTSMYDLLLDDCRKVELSTK